MITIHYSIHWLKRCEHCYPIYNTDYSINNIIMHRKVVMNLLGIFDPQGTEQRKKHRLRRRVYINKYMVVLMGMLYQEHMSATKWCE